MLKPLEGFSSWLLFRRFTLISESTVNHLFRRRAVIGQSLSVDLSGILVPNNVEVKRATRFSPQTYGGTIQDFEWSINLVSDRQSKLER